MGVLKCDRKDCEHIMCERLSDEHGYLCSTCFEELIDLRIPLDSLEIKKFMQTPKKIKHTIDESQLRLYYENIFRRSSW